MNYRHLRQFEQKIERFRLIKVIVKYKQEKQVTFINFVFSICWPQTVLMSPNHILLTSEYERSKIEVEIILEQCEF